MRSLPSMSASPNEKGYRPRDRLKSWPSVISASPCSPWQSRPLALRFRNFISWIYLRRQIDRSGNPRTSCERFTLTRLAGSAWTARTFIPFLITIPYFNPGSSFSPYVILLEKRQREKEMKHRSKCYLYGCLVFCFNQVFTNCVFS